jgi:hypothetical protein
MKRYAKRIDGGKNRRGRNGIEWKEATGRAVICNHRRDPSNFTAALNMGGPHETPGVATVRNIVAIGKNKRCLHTSMTGELNPETEAGGVKVH